MSKNIVIVESPAKTKTIQKYLDKSFQILASYGHVRDLLPKTGSVEPEANFAMHYQVIERNEKHVRAIIKALKSAECLYLATDPDREGEAIAWHMCEILKDSKALKRKAVHRVVFNEITAKAVKGAFQNPREISMDLVNAQQARRALDYLVGFNLSPLLWKKVRPGLSAGRVQSPALRLIAEREAEITQFKPQEYWTIEADCEAYNQAFVAKLIEYQGQKVEQFTFTTQTQSDAVRTELTQLANGKLKVAEVVKKERKRNPPTPFITSTLQQEASRKLGLYAKQTMRTAQQLYEGIDVGEDVVGLITYMRTDSVVLAEEAIEEIRNFIQAQYGTAHLPEQPKRYKTSAKNAQEAHEAIRPTSILRTPESLRERLSKEQWKLYDLIWKRTLACQMNPALYDVVTAELECGPHRLRATGSTLVAPGYLTVYQEGQDEVKKEEEGNVLPSLNRGEEVILQQVRVEQHFTEPPPRYTEASLVKALEEYGIGRPSTYASILSTLEQREYAVLEKKRFIPTDVGIIVNQFLTQYFPRYVDYHFTAELEDELDAIARGEKTWIPVLQTFWNDFKPLVDTIESTVRKRDVTQQPLEEACPECGKPLVIRLGRLGRFVGCTGYPDCNYTRSLKEESGTEKPPEEIVAGRTCPKCEGALVIKSGRYGKFIGCSQYPKCKYIESLIKPESTGIECPLCKQGNLFKRKSRYGKFFYSCERYPDCKYAVWNEPILEACPRCSWPILTLKVTKRRGKEKVCPQEGCGYVISYGAEDDSSEK